jgi:hypothetical protein
MINWPVLPGTMFPCGPPGTLGLQGPIGITGSPGSTGPPGPTPWGPTAPWGPSTSYTASPPASTVTNAGTTYVCTTSHVSTASFDATKWAVIVTAGPTGAQGPAGSIAALAMRTVTATSYTVVSTDSGGVIRFTTAASCAVSLPTFATGSWIFFKNDLASGLVTITPSATTVDGVTAATVDPSCCALITYNGSNYESLSTSDGGRF